MPFAFLALAMVLVVGSAGCSTDDSASGLCLTAFRDAQPRGDAPYRVSPLDDAIKECDSITAWREAWIRVPNAHPTSRDALTFLHERCQVQELQQTALCREVAAGR